MSTLPPPRRTNRATPARTPPRRTVGRYATPARAPMIMSPVRDASVASMDVDDAPGVAPKPDTVFARSSEMTVALYSHLPEEVRQALRNAGM